MPNATHPQLEISAASDWPVVDRLVDWCRMHQRVVLLAAVALQLIVLAGMIAIKTAPLVVGETILVRVVPVDPRDLFRGDYVMLGYDFSQAPKSGIEGLPKPDSEEFYAAGGRPVYVTLVPEADGKHWRAETYSAERPGEGTYLRGQLDAWRGITFGIESYYVQEGTGQQYEEAVRDHTLSAEIAVAPWGEATLKRLVIDEPAGPSPAPGEGQSHFR